MPLHLINQLSRWSAIARPTVFVRTRAGERRNLRPSSVPLSRHLLCPDFRLFTSSRRHFPFILPPSAKRDERESAAEREETTRRFLRARTTQREQLCFRCTSIYGVTTNIFLECCICVGLFFFDVQYFRQVRTALSVYSTLFVSPIFAREEIINFHAPIRAT